MALFQYKTASNGSWIDVPKTAYQGTLEGTFEVQYPEPTAYDGSGRPCAAIGEPKIIMESKIMTASGMAFWQGLFSTVYQLDSEFWLTARDPRINVWNKYTGWIERPVYSRVQVGTGSLNTLYYDVQIKVSLVEISA